MLENHIVLIASHLNIAGGYERIVADTVNLFAKKGKKITLLLLAKNDESFYPLHKNVEVIRLPLDFGIISPETVSKGNVFTRKAKMLQDLLTLRRTLKKIKPSLLIASEYSFVVAAILTTQRNKMKIFSWEHTHFSVNTKNKFWSVMCKLFYPKLDGIICLNPDEKKLHEPLNKNVVVIPNFIHKPNKASTLSNKTILTIARLEAVKGIDLLFKTAKTVLNKHSDWKWKLIGDGALRIEIEEFIKKENLTGQFLLQSPRNHDIGPEYQNASLYVMTSVNECFPMVLLEALSYGLPCIAFNCETGPRHIIKNNVDGMLIEKRNTIAMADAISNLIIDEEKRKAMGENAIENVNRFTSESIYQLWENLFHSI